MDRAKLKTYAPEARREFIQAMKDRAEVYGLTPTKIEPMVETGDVAIIVGREHPRSVARKRKALEDRIKSQGFEQTMEALAYTWFNRLVAIRFMELHGYLDHGYRVLSHPEGKPTPEIIQHAEHVDLPGLKRDTVIDLKLDGNKENELYRLLLVAQCNALHSVMPFLFEKIDDETELLLPDNLLHSDSLIRNLVSNLDEEDCESVEVLGWLYQFYIADRKDQVMARKSVVPTADIPAVTQLFTPHWIVRYLVENSLGRLWLLNRPGSKLRDHMPYYIEGDPEIDFLKINKPEDIRVCDPAVGSGHMLTYAFDLLTLIYEEEGYTSTEIPDLILRHNLYGLDICPRAAQLAALALVFKARARSRRFFQPEHLVPPHIMELQDVHLEDKELRDYIHELSLGNLFNKPVFELLHQFEEAKSVGSLIQPCLDEQTIAFARQAIEAKDLGSQLFLRETHLNVLRVLEQAEALTQRYHVVVANPPYMGSKQMAPTIRSFAEREYPDSKADLFAMFIERGFSLVERKGFSAMVTMESWMFLSAYEAIRAHLVNERSIISAVHMPYLGKGGTSMGINFGTVATIFASVADFQLQGHFSCVRYFETDEAGVPRQFPIQNERLSISTTKEFAKLPGAPIAYWVSHAVRNAFSSNKQLQTFASPRKGMVTADNPRYIRTWWECAHDRIGFGCLSRVEAKNSRRKWFPYQKGGDFRKWYGNLEAVVNWENDGHELLNMKAEGYKVGSTNHNLDYIFKPAIVWTKVTSAVTSFRKAEAGYLFDDASGLCSTKVPHHFDAILGLLCSNSVLAFLDATNPTINLQPGNLCVLPAVTVDCSHLVAEAVEIACGDWNNFETSWDFRDQPFLRPGLKGATLEASWRNWEAQCTAAIRRMQELETENNRLFISAYGLEGELQPDVPEDQITLARADSRRDVAAVLSYSVGCMMGRYSLDYPGLILANAGDTLREFLAKVGRPQDQLTFIPDEDGIVPVLDAEWFEDDIVAHTLEFLRATFGDASLGENVRFIEESLGKDLRKYFLTDFYKDHLQTYKKRPIYWMFSSGKQRAFQCLVYLHRYNDGTLARMRTEYVIPLQGRIASRIEQLEGDKIKASSTSQRNKLQKEQDNLKKQQAELFSFDEKLKHYADQRISLDLDDGVKVNYGKFGDLLAEVKAIAGGKDDD